MVPAPTPGPTIPRKRIMPALLKLRYTIENEPARPSGRAIGLRARRLLDPTVGRANWPTSSGRSSMSFFRKCLAADLLAYLAAEMGCRSWLHRSTASAPTIEAERAADQEAIGLRTRGQGRHTVVAIDEAHLLDGSRSDLLRLLLNFETEAGPAMTLLLVGKPGSFLCCHGCRSWEERLAVKCLLRATDGRGHHGVRSTPAGGGRQRPYDL